MRGYEIGGCGYILGLRQTGKTEGPGCRHLSVVQVKKANSKPSGKDKDQAKTGKASVRQPWVELYP